MTTQEISKKIIDLCQTPNTALQAIHLLFVHGQASSLAIDVLYRRVLNDNDVNGAYYLAVFAQTSELPFDVLPLIQLVLRQGNQQLRLSLLNKLPKAAIEHLQTTMDLGFCSSRMV